MLETVIYHINIRGANDGTQGWLQTCNVAEDGFELLVFLPQFPQMLRLQVCTSMPALGLPFLRSSEPAALTIPLQAAGIQVCAICPEFLLLSPPSVISHDCFTAPFLYNQEGLPDVITKLLLQPPPCCRGALDKKENALHFAAFLLVLALGALLSSSCR